MSADVEPANVLTAVLTPANLALIGWELVRKGEALFEIRVERGAVQLCPVAWFDVRGGADPESWSYHATTAGPNTTETRILSGERVIHVRYAVDPVRPWRGLSPLTWGRRTADLTGMLKQRLGEEARAQVGALLPVPDPKGQDELRRDLAALRGRVSLVKSANQWADPGSPAIRQEWEPRRMGANPPAALDALRSNAGLSILAACGVPVELVRSADGTGQREAWRRFLFGTVAPVAKLVRAELAEKLDTPNLALGFDELRASDLAGRARAFASMVKAGMDVEKAAGIAGLMVE